MSARAVGMRPQGCEPSGMPTGRSAKFALAAAALTCAATIMPSHAQTAYASRTTTITGSFTVGSTVLTLRAETRLRAVASMAPSDPLGIGLNPAESTTTAMVCSSASCVPSTRLCFTSQAIVDDEVTGQGSLRITSADPTCSLDVSATVSSPRTPQFSSNRIESVSSAVFEKGALIHGSTADGTDGKVVRTISWFAG